jgi:Asp/Glu/hydantoin racemase
MNDQLLPSLIRFPAWAEPASISSLNKESCGMRILLMNPNTTESLTERMANSGRLAAAPGTTIVPVTALRGMPYLSSRAEAQIGGAVVLEMLAEHHHEGDAAIVAAFGDPGLFGARELFDIPVVGVSEAAMLTACMLGRRFLIIAVAGSLGSWYEECVDMHGLAARCAGVRSLECGFASISDVQEEKESVLLDLALKAIAETWAEVLIPGGAPLAGLVEKIKTRIPIPVVDPIQASVKMCEALIAMNARKAEVGTFRRPAAKTNIGLNARLAARIAHEEG